MPQFEKTNQQDYLEKFDITKNGGIERQCWAKTNVNKFHKAIKASIVKCTICREARPLKSKPKSAIHTCVHGAQEIKNFQKKFPMKIQWCRHVFVMNYKIQLKMKKC